MTGFAEEELAVLVVETKQRDPALRNELTHRITRLMHEHFGINVIIDLVRSGTLPRTSSGKLSRFKSREAYLDRQAQPALHLPGESMGERKIA